MQTMRVGQSYPVTFTGSDGTTPTEVGALINPGGVASPELAGAAGVVRAIGVGTTTITFTSPGYNPVTQDVTVTPKPDLIVTNGPIT